MAKVIAIGQPVNDAERQAIARVGDLTLEQLCAARGAMPGLAAVRQVDAGAERRIQHGPLGRRDDGATQGLEMNAESRHGVSGTIHGRP